MRSDTQRMISNVVLSTLHKFSSTLFGFLNFLLLVRMLSKSDFGIWSIFLFGITAFEFSKSSLIKNAHIHLLISSTKKDVPAIAGSSLLINTLCSFFFILFILVGGESLSSWLNMSSVLSKMLIAYIPGIILLIFFSHYEAVQQSNNNFKNCFTANIFRQISFFIPLIYFYYFNQSPSLIALVYFFTIANAVGLFVLWLLSLKYIVTRIRVSFKIIATIFSYGGFLMAGNVLSQLTFNVDQILVSRMISVNYVGYYGIASRVMNTLDIPMNGAAEAMFPSYSKAFFKNDSILIKNYLERAIGSLLAIMTPITLILFLFSKQIINVIAGKEYMDADVILKIYLLVIIINIFKHQSSNTLLSLGKTKLHFTINAVETLIFIGAAYLFILSNGLIGAAIARILIVISSLIFWIILMKHYVHISIRSILFYFLKFFPSTYQLLKNK